MLSKLIYELTKVSVYDYIDSSDKNMIECRNTRFGFFENVLDAEQFIRKHNHDDNCFFIMRTYVFNPTHYGQTEDFLTQRTYDYHGELLCDCPTHHFIVNHNELFGGIPTHFTGRDDCTFKRGDTAWFYDEYEDVLYKCKIGEIPFNCEQAKQYEYLDWYDDSFLVYPEPHVVDEDNHQHIISCLVFNNDFVKNLMMKD